MNIFKYLWLRGRDRKTSHNNENLEGWGGLEVECL